MAGFSHSVAHRTSRRFADLTCSVMSVFPQVSPLPSLCVTVYILFHPHNRGMSANHSINVHLLQYYVSHVKYCSTFYTQQYLFICLGFCSLACTSTLPVYVSSVPHSLTLWCLSVCDRGEEDSSECSTETVGAFGSSWSD